MKITITITNCKSNKTCNIQIDNKQKIRTTLRVMNETLNIFSGLNTDNIAVKSSRSKRNLSLDSTYEDSQIYSGDNILVLER